MTPASQLVPDSTAAPAKLRRQGASAATRHRIGPHTCNWAPPDSTTTPGHRSGCRRLSVVPLHDVAASAAS
jgi:hypothetical protein